MNPLRHSFLRLRAVFGRRTLENDMQGEMRDHLDRATDRLIARGMSPEDARIAARREFGNATMLEEEGRDARGARWVDAMRGDARFAIRYFTRHKSTTAIIVAVLALATGGNTVMFSALQSQFFRPAAQMRDDDALARIWGQERPTLAGAWKARPFTRLELNAIAEQRALFQDVAGFLRDEVIVSAADSSSARTVETQFVTPNYFRAAGVALDAGQGFVTGGDETPDMAAVVSHALATQLYGTPSQAVGQQMLVNQVPVRVVGVAPERFQGAIRNMDGMLWIPMSARAQLTRSSPRWADDEAMLAAFARLAPGASREQATALVRQVVNAALPDSAPRVGMARSADVVELKSRRPGSDSYETMLATMMVITVGALILLVACTNISSLMVANAVGRRHEIAVRLSLGASRWRLVRQMITESTVLALVGSAIGLTLAWWVLVYMAKNNGLTGYDYMPDMGTLAFVGVMAVVTGILFGLSPAMHATRGAVAGALRDSGTGAGNRSRLQRGLVVAQIALSQPLLVLLGTMLTLIIGDYEPLSRQMAHNVISVTFAPLASGAPGQRPDDVDSLVSRIALQPRVAAAIQDADAFEIRGAVAQGKRSPSDTVQTIITLEGAAPGWLGLVDVPIVFGRDVAWSDTTAAEYPVVIGSDLARRMWGEENPIGKQLASQPIASMGQKDSLAFTVVGVYDASQRMPGMTFQGYGGGGDKPIRVLTARGKQWRHDRILVRTQGPAAAYLTGLQQYLRSAAPTLPVTRTLTLAQMDERSYEATLQMASMAGLGGAIALALASLGLYGVVSLAVRQRTREIGIRIAVGAHPVKVARMFLASGVRVSVVALAIGLPLSIVGLKIGIKQGLIIAPQVNPYLIGLGIALILVGVAAAATWVPARRAARVDPVRSLRTE